MRDIFTCRHYHAVAGAGEKLTAAAHATRNRDEPKVQFYISTASLGYTGQVALAKVDVWAMRDMLTEVLEDWE